MAGGAKRKLEVRFFESATGVEPVRDWLKTLSKSAMKEIGSDIQRVQWRWPVSKPLVDGLGGGLFEVRTKFGNVQYRVLFCIKDSTIVLLHGFVTVCPGRDRCGSRAQERRRQGVIMGKHIGSKFTDFLEQEGIKNDVDLLTVKKVLADEIQARMEALNIGITQFADRMRTGRDVAYRLLDANDTGVTLKTLSKAARALDWSLVEMLVAAGKSAERAPSKRAKGRPSARTAEARRRTAH